MSIRKEDCSGFRQVSQSQIKEARFRVTVSLAHELAFDESQENGGNFMTTRGNTVIDES